MWDDSQKLVQYSLQNIVTLGVGRCGGGGGGGGGVVIDIIGPLPTHKYMWSLWLIKLTSGLKLHL